MNYKTFVGIRFINQFKIKEIFRKDITMKIALQEKKTGRQYMDNSI